MADTVLVVDPTSHVPLADQIAMQLRTAIAAGTLPVHAPLPSVRQLARDLDVAPNTVVKAYAELEESGWIISRPRRGFVVGPRADELARVERERQLDSAARQLVDTAIQLGLEP